MNMLEKAARALAMEFQAEGVRTGGTYELTREVFERYTRAVLAAIREPDDATANRASDIAYEGKNAASGETCPVMRNHVRSYIDAILEGESK